jgi:RsiW-degrading membrane proteinase PrsW (M82 family)
VFWLWFWLKEDDLHPEPRGLLILSFLVGMLATACAYPTEKYIAANVLANDLTLLFLWALTEETLKFIGIYVVALKSRYFDEPIDGVVYLITIALGFSALENTMFLFNPLGTGDAMATLLLGDFRFIGATLLHVAASGTVGIAIALSYYHEKSAKRLWLFLGLVGAVVLHTAFNFSIIVSEGRYLYEIFIGLWTYILCLLLICEKIKRMAPRSHVEHREQNTLIIPRKTYIA